MSESYSLKVPSKELTSTFPQDTHMQKLALMGYYNGATEKLGDVAGQVISIVGYVSGQNLDPIKNELYPYTVVVCKEGSYSCGSVGVLSSLEQIVELVPPADFPELWADGIPVEVRVTRTSTGLQFMQLIPVTP